jgi:prolyl oligopeptidase
VIPVTDTLHGTRIVDPYRWLEDAEAPETEAFVRQQMAYTRSVLDALPGRDEIRRRLTELLSIGTLDAPQVAGGRCFHTRRDGLQNQPVLYVRDSVHGEDRPLLDVNAIAADGTIALDWWYPSPDGRLLAFGTSAGGSELSTLSVIETASGRLLPDVIGHTRASSVAWLPDESGFFYTRYPSPGSVPTGEETYHRHVFFHRLGTNPTSDPLIFGEGRDAQDWPGVALSEDGRWLLIVVSQGWARSELFLQDLAGAGGPTPVVTGQPFLYGGEPFRGELFIVTNENAPRFRLMKAPLDNPVWEAWQEIVPESDAVLMGIKVIGGALFAQYEENAHSRLKVFSLDGQPIREVDLPQPGTVAGLGGEWKAPDAFFMFNSYAVPPTVYRHHIDSGDTSIWRQVHAPIDTSAYQVRQVWFHSKDGTRLPMFVVGRSDLARDRPHPTLLTGYGGFNISRTPAFQRGLYLWLERGGLFAEANLRGGSEFGEDWHRAGMLANKQNVFDDFIAAAEYLIGNGYTETGRLAIQGGSNGGLLVGAALTQRPELFRAVVCAVPLLDMIRYHHFQLAKLWIAEYGCAADPEQFGWLARYSPYHHVRPGTPYPAVLLITAEHDTRVDPLHARKMTARLQAATIGEGPILLRVEPKAGHGVGKPITKLIEEGTDVWSFLIWQLGASRSGPDAP